MREKRVVALDVGGSAVKSGLVAPEQQIVDDVRLTPMDSRGSAEQILATLASILADHLAAGDGAQGAAFGFPGPFDYAKGVCLIRGVAKFDALYGVNVGAALQALLGKPELEFRFRNDAEASIVGEAVYGAGRAYRRVLGLALGTGCGSAFVADGSVVTKGAGLPPNGWLYPVEFRGQRADDLFSTRGLLARFRDRGTDADDVAAALRIAGSRNEGIIESFEAFGADLGEFLKPFVAAFHADAVLILGGIARAFDAFAPQVSKAIPGPVLKGELGARAALLGAAALFTPPERDTNARIT